MAELKAWKRILRRINKTLWLEKRKRNQEAVTALIWEALDFARRRQWHPLQYSCLENPMDGGAWWAAVHVVAKSQTWLSDFPFTFPFHALEKEMATHSSVLAWRIPGTGEPDGLPSLGSHRVGHDWNDLAAAAAAADLALHIHRLCIHGFNQLWNLWMQRTHCTESLYIRDLSIHRFWYPQGSWNQYPADIKGLPYSDYT